MKNVLETKALKYVQELQKNSWEVSFESQDFGKVARFSIEILVDDYGKQVKQIGG